MKSITKTMKYVCMKTFVAACIMTLLFSANAFADDPKYLIVEMSGNSATCEGVAYFNAGTQEILKGGNSGCTAVPDGKKLSDVKLMWMGGSRSDGTECGGGKNPQCSGSAAVPLSNGASGNVCKASASGMYSSLDYSVSTAASACSGKTAWKVTFTGYHYRTGGIQ